MNNLCGKETQDQFSGSCLLGGVSGRSYVAGNDIDISVQRPTDLPVRSCNHRSYR